MSVDGYTLAAIGVIALAVLILATIVTRLLRDHGVRVARIGVFVERERVDAAANDGEPPAIEQPSSHAIDPDDELTRVEWPKRDPEAPT